VFQLKYVIISEHSTKDETISNFDVIYYVTVLKKYRFSDEHVCDKFRH